MPATAYTAVEGDIAEKHMSVREDFGADGMGSASVTLRVPWDLRHTVSADVLLNRYLWPGGGFFGAASRVGIVPEPNSGYTVASGMIAYEFAEVTIEYSSSQADQEEDDDGNIFSESLEPHTEFVTQDPRGFRWGSAGGEPLMENEAPGKMTKSMQLVRTLYGLAAIPAVILSLGGTSNDAEYTSAVLGLTFPEETLLFGDPTMSRSFSRAGTGDRTWTLILKFLYKKDGWNKYWRAKTNAYESIYHVSGAQHKDYPPGDFSELLF